MSIILPTRRIVSPRIGEVEIDWSNPINRGLKMFGLMTGNRPVDLVVNKSATVDSTLSSVINTRRGAAFQAAEAAIGTGPLQFGVCSVVNACTVLFHYHNTSGSLHTAAAFGDGVGAEQINAYMPYTDGTLYWDFGSDSTGRTTASGLTYGNDAWVLTAGGGAMGIWQNGINRTLTTGHSHRSTFYNTPMGVMKYNGGGGNTREANSQVFAIWDRVLTNAEIAEISRNFWTGLKIRRPRRSILNVPVGSTRVSQTTAPTWNVLSAVSQTAAPTWNVLAAISQSTAPTWNVLSAVSQTTSPTWNVLTAVSKTVAPIWNVLTSISQTVAPTWNVLAQVSQTVSPTWDVGGTLTRVGQTIAPTWNVLAQVNQTAAPTWNVLTAISQTITPTWNTLAKINQTVSPTWNVLYTGGGGVAPGPVVIHTFPMTIANAVNTARVTSPVHRARLTKPHALSIE